MLPECCPQAVATGAVAAERALWMPGSEAPAHLTGT